MNLLSKNMRRNPLEQRLFPQPVPVASPGLSKVKIRWGSKAFDPYLLEVPQQIDLMSAMLSNGENFYAALTRAAGMGHGKFAAGLARVKQRLELGEALEEALENLDRECASPLVSEFCNKVSIALTRGTPMAQQLELLSQSSRAQLRNQLLKQAGKNELKMLIPMVFLILPVTIFFAIFPSLQLLQVGL
jgi:tight adherence protein C